MKKPKWLRPYLPNTSNELALVSLSDREPFRAFWPIVLTQLVGGRTWSISFIRHKTLEPIPTEEFRAKVAAEMERLRETP